MARRTAMSEMPRRWILGGVVAVLAIIAVVLTLLALNHVRMRPTDGGVAPVPSFTQPATQSPAPTTTPTPTATTTPDASYDRSQERFLTASAGVLWRGTAGQCGSVEPVLERSDDGGENWIDVTPRYLGIGQLVAVNPFADGQAEIISLMDAECEVQALRTFTQGEFWESYDDMLAASQYVDPTDAGSIVRPDGAIEAPCADARSLRAAGSVLTVVCDGIAYVLDQDAQWLELPATSVLAVDLDGEEVVVAHVSEQCAGIAVARYSVAGDEQAPDAGCADAAESGTASAIAAYGEDVVVWAGTTTVSVSE